MKANILKQHRIPTYAILATALASAQLASPATTIVNEDFTDIIDETELNGQTADTFASGITAASGSSTWAARTGGSNGITDTGTFINPSNNGSSAYLNMGSYINDTKGTASGFFTATATLDSLGTGLWVGFGFFQSNTPATDAHFASTSDGAAFMLYRGNGLLDGFALGTSNNVDGGITEYNGPQLMSIELDLTPAGGYGTTNFGTATFYQGDVATGTKLGSYIYTSDISFGSIGLTAISTSSFDADSLTLTQVPEPSSIALFGLAGLALILRRRK